MVPTTLKREREKAKYLSINFSFSSTFIRNLLLFEISILFLVFDRMKLEFNSLLHSIEIFALDLPN